MTNQVIEVFNKLDSMKKDYAGRIINANCKTGYAYVHSTWGSNGTKASLQLTCAPLEYHNVAAGRHSKTGIVNGYRIEGITGCNRTGRSAVEVAADMLADAVSDLASFIEFLETSPSDAYPNGIPQVNRNTRITTSIAKQIVINDRLMSNGGRSVVVKSHGNSVLIDLAKKHGRDIVDTAINNLTVNEFELRFGL
jgi:hypothetical protein